MKYFLLQWHRAVLTTFSLVVLLTNPARAQQRVQPGAAAPTGQPISEVLNPDGTLKRDASGSFDPTGYQLDTASNGQPVFRLAAPNGPGDENWLDGFTVPGVGGNVYALAVMGTDVYVGGAFSAAGNTPARNIAKWDGSNWSALGTGTNSAVTALAVSGTDVYVGGFFTAAGGVSGTNYIGKWNGSAWSALGTGVDGTVRALAISGANLYVGGDFTQASGTAASHVAKWNGSTWSALAAGVSGSIIGTSNVYALAVSGTDVYAGGIFTQAGSTAASSIAKWNGSVWSALGAGVGPAGNMPQVDAVAVSGTDVYIGGIFDEAGGVPAEHIAKWNGSVWSALGAGTDNCVRELTVSGSTLYAGGNFTQAGGVPANAIAKWNGSTWSALGTGVVGPGGSTASATIAAAIGALVVSGTSLYVGGDFTAAGGGAARGISKWSGSAWSALGTGAPGFNDAIRAVAVAGTDVYVGGDFIQAGGTAANHVAKWNGSTWSALGAGVNDDVYALALSGTDLYAGGSFTQAGGVPASHVAKWNGTAWSALTTGVDGQVYALAASGTNLYVGGEFTQAGGTAASGIAKWVGGTWSSLGTGITSANGYVRAIAVSGANVYVGGNFTSAGGVAASYVAKWNGTNWGALGPGFGTGVWALAASGADVYVGGNVTTAGGIPATSIAKWNGSTWSALGTGATGTVMSLAISGTDVYAGGSFTAGGVPDARMIAKWNGSVWSAFGTGLNSVVYALAVSSNGNVNAGGYFTTTGDRSKVSAYFGIYHTALSPTITSFTPTSGPVGTVVTLTGTNFTGATGLTLNGVPVTNFTMNPAGTSLTFTVPANALPGSIAVATPGGAVTATGTFCVQYQPFTTGAARCGPGSVILMAAGAPVSGASYSWYTTATGGTPISGATIATYTTPALSTTTSYYVAVAAGTGAAACVGPRVAATATINTAPVPTVTPNGPTSFCLGGSVMLTATGGGSYQWNTGATTASITVSAAGSYTVTATGAPGCAATSSPVVVSVTAAPAAGFAYATVRACAGTPTVLMPTLSPGATAGTFTLSPATGLLLNPATGAIQLASATPGTYAITNTVAASGTCAAVAATRIVTVLAPPVATLTATGPTTFCAGDSVRLTVGTPVPGSTYQWNTGATTPTLTARATGTYFVTVTNVAGCTATSTPLNVIVQPTPAAPTVTAAPQPSGTLLLTSSAPTGNQWFYNGTPIAGATATTYVVGAAAQNGTYTVMATAPGACPSALSTPVSVVVTGLPWDAAPAALVLYPNPACETVQITGTHGVQVQLLDALGRVVRTAASTVETTLLDVRGLPTGVYSVRVGQATRRLLVD